MINFDNRILKINLTVCPVCKEDLNQENFYNDAESYFCGDFADFEVDGSYPTHFRLLVGWDDEADPGWSLVWKRVRYDVTLCNDPGPEDAIVNYAFQNYKILSGKKLADDIYSRFEKMVSLR